MNFIIKDELKLIKGRLLYRASEHSLDFTGPEVMKIVADNTKPLAPLIISENVQLEYDVESGRLYWVWGYLPRSVWQSGVVAPPLPAEQRMVCVNVADIAVDLADGQGPIQPGVGVAYRELEHEPAVYDENTGWIRIGSEVSQRNVRLANDIVIGLSGASLTSVFLRPRIVEK